MPHRLDINIEPAQTTLIPKKIFDPELEHAVAELNFGFDAKSQVVLSEISNDIVFLSVVDKKVYDRAVCMFPNGKFFSTYRLLFQGFKKLTHADRRSKHQVFVNTTPDSFDLFVFEKNQGLIFANTFAYQSSNDFLYYFLHAVNRLKIDTGGLTLKVSGFSDNSEKLTSVLEPYFLSIVELSGNENPLNLRMCIQHGLSLINPALCE
ncbi:MAG: DUF3822 family protein [Bacteroidales bacterium]|nr:DUF3822 family protein [Bacteroidales bacterium]